MHCQRDHQFYLPNADMRMSLGHRVRSATARVTFISMDGALLKWKTAISIHWKQLTHSSAMVAKRGSRTQTRLFLRWPGDRSGWRPGGEAWDEIIGCRRTYGGSIQEIEEICSLCDRRYSFFPSFQSPRSIVFQKFHLHGSLAKLCACSRSFLHRPRCGSYCMNKTSSENNKNNAKREMNTATEINQEGVRSSNQWGVNVWWEDSSCSC